MSACRYCRNRPSAGSAGLATSRLGVGQPASDIQGALEYDDAQFERLLRDGVGRGGKPIGLPWWATAHTPAVLTDGEIAGAIAYTRALARHRMQ